ncbi:hypothetical protein ElyMa_000329300 [Elysia marginata]|uniref:Ig-like domain-containing protein n=1 Tax=Elysia marginata TaxID=1093978 RepID=A0AAV4FB22_9GAST|nr:hypothetical protein ElyMa_000329300 [Elysia marginata]
MTSATAAIGTTPTLSCSAHSVLGALSISILRQRDGAILKESVESGAIVTLGPLLCEDTGVYECRVHNIEVTRTYQMNISVPCPPQLITNSLPVGIDSPFYNGSVGEDLIIHLDILSSPPPNWLSLTTLNSKDVLAFRTRNSTEDAEESSVSGQERYEFKYVPASPPYGSVELKIRNLTYDDIGNLFTLVVGNGVEANMSYAFMIREAHYADAHGDTVTKSCPPSSRSSLNIPALALGSSLAALVLTLLAVLVGWMLCRRYVGKRADVAAMEQDVGIKLQSSGINFVTASRPATGSPAVFDFSDNTTSRSRSLTFHVKALQQRNLQQQSPQTQHQQRQQSHIQQQQQQRNRFEQSVDEENFSKDYQPQDRLSRPHGPSECVEYPYYVPGVDVADGALTREILGTSPNSDPILNIYSTVPRTWSVPIDLEGIRAKPRSLTAKSPGTGKAGEQHGAQDSGLKVNKSIERDHKIQKETRQAEATKDLTACKLFDYTESPKDSMRAPKGE